jgi:hypothetical protein
MNKPDSVQIESTSAKSAKVSPIVLRQTEQVRLVFVPQLIENEKEASASVKGCLAYQRKKKVDDWEPIESINLSHLRSGDGVKLDLRGAEVMELYSQLSALYQNFEEMGIKNGKINYTLIDSHSSSRQILEQLGTDVDPEVVGTVFDWFSKQDETILNEYFRSSPTGAMARLDSVLGVSRLENFLNRAEPLMSSDNEHAWQRLLEEDNWTIGQVFATPILIVNDQVFVGGKGVKGTGGNVADFLYRNSISDNCLLVEIKTPQTPLLYTKTKYRNGAYNISKELAGASQQIRQNTYMLRRSYDSLNVDEEPKFRIYSPRSLLMIGSSSSLDDNEKKRSFELYRANLRDVDVITFDELVDKVKLLLELLRGDTLEAQ